MIACVDVDYREPIAVAACVLLVDWSDSAPAAEWTTVVENVAPYEPGAFYKRELPCLLAVLKQAPPLDAVVVDAYVDTAPGSPGLGRHLFDAMRVPAIGVAKTKFANATHAIEVLRGDSKTPLFVTAAGVDPHAAAEHVKRMAGAYRMPAVLRRVDRLRRDFVLRS